MIFLEENLNEEIIKYITEFIFISDTLKLADCIFIPGSFCSELAVHAASIIKQGYSNIIIPSGRYSAKNEYVNNLKVTEALFLTRILVENNVAVDKIMPEEFATFTIENAKYSKILLEKNDIDISSAIICCKSFHAKRCLLIYKTFFPKANIYISPVNVYGINRENWYKTKKGVDTVLGEMTKIIEQVSEDNIKKYL